ncbi:hypothetical protein RB195_019908 [Necator americanus]|uniref:Uncharacterized protein n=1 Tax=Necator americanus TaxID=51031 RepID=A0ABR1CJW5_NECAM
MSGRIMLVVSPGLGFLIEIAYKIRASVNIVVIPYNYARLKREMLKFGNKLKSSKCRRNFFFDIFEWRRLSKNFVINASGDS